AGHPRCRPGPPQQGHARPGAGSRAARLRLRRRERLMPYALREALAAFRRSPLLTGLSAAMIGLSLFVLGLFGIAAHNIRLVLDDVESRVEVVAYLRDDATSEQIEAMREELQRRPEVREVLAISRREAFELARQQLTDFE